LQTIGPHFDGIERGRADQRIEPRQRRSASQKPPEIHGGTCR
jgi:hypothetical protein